LLYGLMAYGVGLVILWETTWAWWYLLAALPVGAAAMLWEVYQLYVFVILLLPGTGILLMLWLMDGGHYGWTISAGIGYLIAGPICCAFGAESKTRFDGTVWLL